MGLLQAGAVSSDLAGGKCCDLSLGQPHRAASFLRQLRLPHLSESPDWSTGKPDFDKMKIGVNAWLFDDFNPDVVPVTVIDGKNLW